MTPTIPEIPEVLRLEAIAAGLEAPEADALWDNYCRWSLSKYPDRGLGGTSWTRQIKMQLERRASEDTKRIFVAKERAAKKSAEDAAYAREACTFPQWVAGLQARAKRGESLPNHEQTLVKWAETSPAGGMLEFMSWHASMMDRVNAAGGRAAVMARAAKVYVSPDEQRRSDLADLEYFDEGGAT